jgi:hypothetical protein
MHKKQFQHMSSTQLNNLVDLLEAIHLRDEESERE